MSTKAVPRKTTFGPGWLEEITLTSSTSSGGTRYVRAKGHVTVCDENGWEVRTRIDIRGPLFEHGPFDTPNDIAERLVEWALEDSTS